MKFYFCQVCQDIKASVCYPGNRQSDSTFGSTRSRCRTDSSPSLLLFIQGVHRRRRRWADGRSPSDVVVSACERRKSTLSSGRKMPLQLSVSLTDGVVSQLGAGPGALPSMDSRRPPLTLPDGETKSVINVHIAPGLHLYIFLPNESRFKIKQNKAALS